MPIFDFICTECGFQFEKIVRPGDTVACENCGVPMMKMVSAPSVRVAGVAAKGGGMDRFTADMMGVRLDELPAHMKHDAPPE